MRLIALCLALAGCSSTPIVVDPGGMVTALAFESGGTLLVGRNQGVARMERSGRAIATWDVRGSPEGFAFDGRGGFFTAANQSASNGVPEDCVVTAVDAAGQSRTLSRIQNGCRAIAFDGSNVVVGGMGGLVTVLDQEGRTIRQHAGEGIVRSILVLDGTLLVAGQSSNGGFVRRVDGWSKRFGEGYFDVAKDTELSVSGSEIRVVGSRMPDPDVDRLEGFFATVGVDGSSFSLRPEPMTSAVHAISGSHVAGHTRDAAPEIGGCPLSSHGGSDAYVATLAPNGSLGGAWIVGSETDEYGYAIAVAEDGRIAAGGKRGEGGWLAIFPRGRKRCGSLLLPKH